MSKLLPAQQMPHLDLPLVGSGRWRLAENAPETLLMIDVYRGLHCPRCRRHLEEMALRSADREALGLELIAISTDPEDRAQKARADWDIDNIPIAYDLSIETARALGLFISENYATHETQIFAEPGVFFVRQDLTLYGAVINTFPFARPHVDDLIEVAKVIQERNYPPRGTLAA